MILIACNSNQIFRLLPDYYLQYCYKGTDKAVRFPSTGATFSPNGKIAYAKENNLYIYDLAAKSTTQITTDGKKTITDWVYEEVCFCKSI
jgi:dipeptidyl-peptidase-4